MTLEEAITKYGPPDKRGHVTRYSDSSLYDEICVLCRLTDGRGSDITIYNTDCPDNPPEEKPVSEGLGDLPITPDSDDVLELTDVAPVPKDTLPTPEFGAGVETKFMVVVFDEAPTIEQAYKIKTVEASKDLATAAAERLAKEYPKSRVGIFEQIDTLKATMVVYSKAKGEW